MANTQTKKRKAGGIPFSLPPTITNPLLEDLKAGRKKYKPGQWFWSPKYQSKVKYLGTYQLVDYGVVVPIVKFSWPKKKEDAITWNNRFVKERQDLIQREKQYTKRYPQLNERTTFTKEKLVENNLTLPNSTDENLTKKKLDRLPNRLYGRIKNYFKWSDALRRAKEALLRLLFLD
jgi:hypothetical protein